MHFILLFSKIFFNSVKNCSVPTILIQHLVFIYLWLFLINFTLYTHIQPSPSKYPLIKWWINFLGTLLYEGNTILNVLFSITPLSIKSFLKSTSVIDNETWSCRFFKLDFINRIGLLHFISSLNFSNISLSFSLIAIFNVLLNKLPSAYIKPKI